MSSQTDKQAICRHEDSKSAPRFLPLLVTDTAGLHPMPEITYRLLWLREGNQSRRYIRE